MQHPYAAFVGGVEKPARYLGGEYQSVRKDWDSVDVRVALAFPDVYDIGMSHLGTKILYSLLNKHPRIACERAFAPWVDMEARAARARAAAGHARERAAAARVRRGRHLAAVRADLHQRADAARPRRHPAARGRSRRGRIRWCSAAGPTATHPEPVAPFFDALPHRRGRGGAARAAALSMGAHASAQGCRGASGSIRAGRARRRLRAGAVHDRRRRRAPGSRWSTAPLDPRVPRAVDARRGSRTSTQYPFPIGHAGAVRRGGVRSRRRSRSRAAAPRAAASARRA